MGKAILFQIATYETCLLQCLLSYFDSLSERLPSLTRLTLADGADQDRTALKIQSDLGSTLTKKKKKNCLAKRLPLKFQNLRFF